MYLKSECDFNMNVGFYESSDESDGSLSEDLDPHLGNKLSFVFIMDLT